MHKILALKKTIIAIFIVLGALSVAGLDHLKFSFDFSQFFPEGDTDLEFYKQFIAEFGTDDNFLLVAVVNETTVFEEDFLERFHQFSVEAEKLPYITDNQSLTTLFYPLKTSFGYTRLPIIHRKDPTRYASDLSKLKKDGLFMNTLIDAKATSLVLALETEDKLDYEQSIELLSRVRGSLEEHHLVNYHLLGRAYFYEAMIAMQKNETITTSISSIVLIFIILFFIYRRITVVFICLISILMALLLFLGLLSVLGKELNAMAAFYPILMLIVGTSDVIHIIDDYLAKIKAGFKKGNALVLTLREVGMSTFLTSITTAIGFASLLTSKSSSIKDFGINSALGVLTAFVTVIFFTSALVLLPKPALLLPRGTVSPLWPGTLNRINQFTKRHYRTVLYGSLIFTLLCVWGVTKVDTNYQIKESLPKGSAIAKDFSFFQQNYAGFRPLEVAVLAQNDSKVTDYRVVQEIEKVEEYMKSLTPINNVQSANTLYKTLHKAHHLNSSEHFVLPRDMGTFNSYKKDIKKMARKQFNKFVNAEETKARITSRILDIGTDTLNKTYEKLHSFVATKIDTSIVKFRLTGSGVLLDKNSYYVRDSLLKGLFMGLLLVALLMALIFKDLKLMVVSLVPNLLPLLFAGALLGFFAIPLEATISVVFAIVFGIAVDDTIHFLGRYRICRAKGLNKEEALEVTFNDTGRALIITTLTLFSGFMILLFSIHSPSVTIGILVSVTLLTALVLDLLLLPVLIRRMLK